MRTLALSTREAEVARSIFDDHGEARIAADLGISVHTVHTHIRRLYLKTGTHSRVELALLIVSSVRKK